MTLNSGSPVFRVSWLGFARGDPTWGLSVSFVFLLCLFSVGVFARFWGACFPPPKKWFSPVFEGRVCAEWQNTLPPKLFSSAGRAAWKGPAPTKTPFFAGEIQRDAVGRTCNCDVCECPFGPLPEPPLLLCAPVKVATGKPSVLQAETYRTRDLSVVLETHQLYSRLIS